MRRPAKRVVAKNCPAESAAGDHPGIVFVGEDPGHYFGLHTSHFAQPERGLEHHLAQQVGAIPLVFYRTKHRSTAVRSIHGAADRLDGLGHLQRRPPR